MKTHILYFKKVLLLFSCLLIYLSPYSLSAQVFGPVTSPLTFDGGTASFTVPASGVECLNGGVSLSADIDGAAIGSTITISGPGINTGSNTYLGLDPDCGNIGIFQIEPVVITDAIDFDCLVGGSTLDYTFEVIGNDPSCNPTLLLTMSYFYNEPEAPTPITTTPTAMDLDPAYVNFNSCAADAIANLQAAGAFNRNRISNFYEDNCAIIAGNGGRIINRDQMLSVDDDCGWEVTFTYDVRDFCNISSNLIGETIIFSGSDQTDPTITVPIAITVDIGLDANCEIDNATLLASIQADGAYSVMDNCMEPTAVVLDQAGPFTGVCAAGVQPTVMVTLTATDECGNDVTSSMIEVTLEDVTPPAVAVPATLTVDIGMNAACEISAADLLTAIQADAAYSVMDNCTAPGDIAVVLDQVGPFTGACIAGVQPTVMVTITATDLCGNPMTSSMIELTLEDVTPPAVAVPATLTVDIGMNAACEISAADLLTAIQADAAYSVMDNCTAAADIAVVLDQAGPFTGACTAPGVQPTVMVTITATDLCGNPMTSNMITVTLEDVTPPTISPIADIGPLQVILSDCDFNLQIPAPAIADNCTAVPAFMVTNDMGVTIQTITDPWLGQFPVGVTTVTVTATDDCGNMQTEVFTVTVEDNILPTVACPPDLLGVDAVPTDANLCVANYEVLAAAVGSDNCNITDLDVTFAANAANPLIGVPGPLNFTGTTGGTTTPFTALYEKGITDVTYTFTDENGNTDACTQMIEVTDQEAPVFTYVNNITITTEDAPNPSLCPGVVPLTDLAPGGFPGHINFGDDPVAPATFTVAGVTFPAPPSTAMTDNCPEKLLRARVVSTNQVAGVVGNTVCTSQVIIIWQVTDCGGNIDEEPQTFMIEDKTAPVWTTAAGDLDATVDCDDAAALATAQGLSPVAVDLCDPDVSDGIVKTPGAFVAGMVCPQAGTITNTWTVTDDCGNTSAVFTQTITIVDTEVPTWTTAVGDLDATVECSDAAALMAAQALVPVATDNCDTDVTDIVEVSGAFVASTTCPQAGTYTNTWTVTDDCGNTSAVFTQTINVVDTELPTWTTAAGDLDITLQCSDVAGIATAQALFPVATDNCDTDVTDIIEVSGAFVAGACPQAGTYTNTWTVTDDCGNTSAVFTQSITLIDTEVPVWTTAAGDLDRTLECSDAAGIAAAQALVPVATDNCDTDVSNVDKISGAFVAGPLCPQAGTYTNTWTVTDDCGNISAVFTQMITIEDNTPPVVASIVLPPSTTGTPGIYETAGSCDLLVPVVIPLITDACDPLASFGPNPPTAATTTGQVVQMFLVGNTWQATFPVGITTVSTSAIDACGNSTPISYTIEIQDNELPIIQNCPTDITVDTDPNICDASVTFDEAFVTDNCDVTNLDIIFSGNAIGNPGQINIVGAAADGGGQQTVTFQKGATTVTFNFTDENGNVNSSCSLMVTVEDNQAPTVGNAVATPIALTTSGGADCPSGAIADFGAPSGPVGFGASFTVANLPFTGPVAADFGDNCPVTDGTLDVSDIRTASGACMTEIEIDWTYTDCGGNPVTQTQVFTITDDEAPTGDASSLEMTDINDCAANALAAVPIFDPVATAALYSDPNNCNSVSITLVSTDDSGVDCQIPGGWTVTYTYDVTDGCNTVSGTIVHSGYDQDEPTLIGAAPAGDTDIDACAADALTAVPAFVVGDVEAFYEDECNNVTVTLTGTADSGVDCQSAGGWSVTYTYDVADDCGNVLMDETITHSGYDQDAPTLIGAAPMGMTDIDACAADAISAVPAFVQADVEAFYEDECNNVIVTLTGTADSGVDCQSAGGWSVTYTYDVEDDCGNVLMDETITHSGYNQTSPTIPVAQQQADLTLFTVPTDCNRNAAILVPPISDACGNTIPSSAWSITSDDPNLTFLFNSDINGDFWDGDFQVGITVVTISAMDVCGLSVSDVIIVDVIDNISPTIVTGTFANPCPGPIVNLTAGGANCDAVYSWVDPGFTDNCDIPGGTISFTNGIPTISGPFSATGGVPRSVTFPLGTTTVTYTVFDNANPPGGPNSAVLCTFDVVVVDGGAPTAVCPTLSDISLDASGNGSIAANIGTGLSTDNCAGVIPMETSPAASFTCADLGPQIVVLTATDSDGNVGTANCTFNVVDNMAPTAMCTSVVVSLDATGSGSTTAAAIDASTDNCAVTSSSLDISSFDCTNIGPNTVILTVADATGNTSTCTATVNVADGIVPAAICPTTPTIALDAVTGTVILPATLGDGSSTDNCGVPTEFNTTPMFDCTDIGTQTYDLTATDSQGNATTVTCNVNIVDTSGPLFTCPMPIIDGTTITDCNVTVRIPIPALSDNCTAAVALGYNNGGLPFQSDAAGVALPVAQVTISNLSIVNVGTEWQAEFPLGTTYLTISATDAAGITTTCTFTVIVNDPFDPSVGCPTLNVSLDASGNGSINVNQFTAGDNCGVTSVTLVPSAFTCADIGAQSAVLTVVDDTGNTNTCTSTINVTDNIAPVITLVGNAVEFFNCGGTTYTDAGVTVTDNCDMSLTATVTGGPVDVTTPGTYVLTYSATDASGNAATPVTRTIIVNDPLGGYNPGSGIVGDAVVCAGKDAFVYSIPSPPLGSTVTWTHSLGTAVFAAGQGTGSVTVNFPDDPSLADGYCVVDGSGSNGGTIEVEILGGCTPTILSLPITYLDDELCSIYNCFVDLHVNDALTLPAADSPTLYQADQRLSSDGTVQTGRIVDYTAGICIELKPGFEVELTAEFLADIVPCASQSFTRGEADTLINALEKEGINLDRNLLKIENR